MSNISTKVLKKAPYLMPDKHFLNSNKGRFNAGGVFASAPYAPWQLFSS